MVCNKKIAINEMGLWSKGVGVKHQECAQLDDDGSNSNNNKTKTKILCAVCKGPAGCTNCEFAQDCDLDKVSQACICLSCIDKTADPFLLYQNAVKDRHGIITSNES